MGALKKVVWSVKCSLFKVVLFVSYLSHYFEHFLSCLSLRKNKQKRRCSFKKNLPNTLQLCNIKCVVIRKEANYQFPQIVFAHFFYWSCLVLKAFRANPCFCFYNCYRQLNKYLSELNLYHVISLTKCIMATTNLLKTRIP